MIRAIRDEDFNALLACWNASARFDPLPERIFRDKLDDDDFDTNLTLVDEDGGIVRGFIMGVVRGGESERRAYVKLLSVSDAFRRSRVGGRLLMKMIERVEHAGAASIRVGESAPNYLTPGLDVRYTAALAFFESFGFSAIGEAYDMEVGGPELERLTLQAETAAIPTDMELRRARPTDRHDLDAFLERCWPAWRPEVALSMNASRPRVHLGLHKGEIVAFSAYEGNNAGMGTFGPMGTAPRFEGLGLGRQLLRRCLRDLSEMGYGRVTIPWVAPVGFYANTVGATIKRVFVRLERKRGDT